VAQHQDSLARRAARAGAPQASVGAASQSTLNRLALATGFASTASPRPGKDRDAASLKPRFAAGTDINAVIDRAVQLTSGARPGAKHTGVAGAFAAPAAAAAAPATAPPLPATVSSVSVPVRAPTATAAPPAPAAAATLPVAVSPRDATTVKTMAVEAAAARALAASEEPTAVVNASLAAAAAPTLARI